MKENILFNILIWLVGLITTLTIGSGMINKTLTIPGIPEIITFISGWVVVVGAIICAIILAFTK